MKSKFMGETLTRPELVRGCDPRATHAFTLLEILVTLAIIGLLVGLAVVDLGRVHKNAEDTTARLFVQQTIKSALQLYRIHMGEYPSTNDGLQPLLSAPAGNSGRWSGPYLDRTKVPLDPWNEPYQYAFPGKHNKDSYDVWSKGKDKISGTEDDIGNWETRSP